MGGCIRCVGAAGTVWVRLRINNVFFFAAQKRRCDTNEREEGSHMTVAGIRPYRRKTIRRGAKISVPAGLIVAHVFNEGAGYCYDD